MNDPRNFVASSPFSCEREGGRYHLHGAWAGWPEVVAFARAILAADEAWLDSRTPTLEELRAKYPNMVLTCRRVEQSYGAAISTRSFAFAKWRHSLICQEVGLPTEKAALRWLAAKLEELT